MSRDSIIASRRFKTLTPVLCALAAIVATLAAYANVVTSFFLSDDFAQIGKVLEGDLSVTWGQSHGGFFRPLFILSYFIDTRLWTREPAGFHLTNLTLHGLNAVLVLRLARSLMHDARLSTGEQRAVALGGALVFLLHPSHTEAVTWISGRADVLSTFFTLLSMLAFVSHARTRRPAPLALSLALCALALLSKEAAISVPFIMLCTGIYLAKTDNPTTVQTAHDDDDATATPRRVETATLRNVRDAMWRNVRAAALFFLMLALYIGARSVALGTLVGGYGAGQHLNFTHGVVASQLLRFSLRALFPALLLRSLPFLESRALSPILIMTGAAVILIAVIVLRRRERRRSILARMRRNTCGWLLLALFVSSLLPVINLRINVFDTQGERFLYLASVFSSLALAFVLKKLIPRRAAWTAAIGCLLAFYAVTLWQTNRIWREASALSRDIIDDTARHATHETVVLLNLPDNLRGAHLYRNGFEQALRSFQDAKTVEQAHVVAYHGLDTAGDRLELREEQPGVFALRLLDGKTTFERVDAPPACIEILERSARILRFRLQDCPPTIDVRYYSAGQVFIVKPEN